MDAKAAQVLQLPGLVQPEKVGRRTGCRLSRTGEPQKLRVFVSGKLHSTIRRRIAPLEVACSYDKIPGCYKTLPFFTFF